MFHGYVRYKVLHKVFIINTLFHLCARHSLLKGRSSSHKLFQLVVVRNAASSECILQGAQKDGSWGEGVQNRECRMDEGGQIQGADLWG